MTDTLCEALERLLEKWEAKSNEPTFDEFDQLVCNTYGSRASDLRALLADHPAPSPRPGRCTCGLPGCSDEPDTVGEPVCDCGAPVSAHGGEMDDCPTPPPSPADDWMLRCDTCGRDYPAHEELRGTGAVGIAEARRRAALDGWTHHEHFDYCPDCTPAAPVPSPAPVDERCPTCGVMGGTHGLVHRRHPQGGGGVNVPCPAGEPTSRPSDLRRAITAAREDAERVGMNQQATDEWVAIALLTAGWRSPAEVAALVAETHATTRAQVAGEIAAGIHEERCKSMRDRPDEREYREGLLMAQVITDRASIARAATKAVSTDD